jgi:hypothetical protein
MMIKTICKSSGSVKCAKRMSDTLEATPEQGIAENGKSFFGFERKARQNSRGKDGLEREQ